MKNQLIPDMIKETICNFHLCKLCAQDSKVNVLYRSLKQIKRRDSDWRKASNSTTSWNEIPHGLAINIHLQILHMYPFSVFSHLIMKIERTDRISF